MCTSVQLFVVFVIGTVTLAQGISVRQLRGQDIISKFRTELPLVKIICSQNDLIILSAPVVSGKNSIYHLYNPKGEIRKLHLHPTPSPNRNHTTDYDTLSVKTYKELSVITKSYNYRVFNVNHWPNCVSNETQDEYACQERAMDSDEFIIGPVSEDDYGNWVVSAFFKDDNGEWAEVYRTFAVDIRNTEQAMTQLLQVNPGDTFEIGFAYPMKDLESCELIAPRSTFDRFYSRNQLKLNSCRYVVTNATLQDAGLWRIIGVGRLTYETYVRVIVSKNKTRFPIFGMGQEQNLVNPSQSQSINLI